MATLAPPSTDPAVPALAVAAPERCPSCATPLAGEYCHACGERRHTDERFSVRHFLSEVAGELLDADSRAIRSVRLLVTRPGFLTLEALRGRKRPYVGALKMYLLVFGAVMFLATFIPEPASRGGKQNQRVAAAFGRLVHSIAVHQGTSDGAARKALAQATTQHTSWLSVIIPLLFAVALYAVFRRRRRFYAENLVFATHFATFNYLVGIVLLPIQVAGITLGLGVALVTGLGTVAAMVAYLSIAIRRVYGSGTFASAGWSLLFLVVFGIVQSLVGLLAFCTASAQLLWL